MAESIADKRRRRWGSDSGHGMEKCDCGQYIMKGSTCPSVKHLGKGSRSYGKSGYGETIEDKQAAKRCPGCRGDNDRFSGQGLCWLATCTRGPNGGRCGCHYQLTGMGAPTKTDHFGVKLDDGPDPRAFGFARHVI